MAKLVSNYTANGSSTTDEYGTFIVLNRFLVGDVVEGFDVVANSSPNMTVYVQPGSGRITTGTYPSSYGYLISHDTGGQGEPVTIATAAASPRIDYIVAYIDKAVAGSIAGGNVNNTNNVLKFAAVAGTPSGSPVVPTVGQIQTAIGAANPYIILKQAAVAANVTTITNANLTDKRVFIYGRPDPSGWTPFTPAVTAGVNSFTSVSAPNCFYKQSGKTVHASFQINIATPGTASGAVRVQLPVAPNLTGGRGWIGYGREDAINGKMLQGVAKSGSDFDIFTYDNTTVANVSGAVVRATITYEAA